jgi:hypothetical protein
MLGYLAYLRPDDDIKLGDELVFTAALTLLFTGMAAWHRKHVADMATVSRQHASELDAKTRFAIAQIEATAAANAAKIEALLLTMQITCKTLGMPEVTASGDSLPPGTRKPHLRGMPGGKLG